MRFAIVSVVFLSLLFSFSSISAQVTQLYQINGAATRDEFGFSVAGVGDVNDDGKMDLIIGAPFGDTPSGYVYSGATGTLVYWKTCTPCDSFPHWLGSSVNGAGDVDGDGTPDFIIADPLALIGAGSVFVYSGATGTSFYQKNGFWDDFGFSVAGAGDVNGDGFSDFVVGAPSAHPGGLSNAGSAFLYSGATGALLFQKNGGYEDRFGFAVGGAGDVNGDGKADFIVGALLADSAGVVDAGSAFVYSGGTGELLYQMSGAATDDWFGKSAAGAGDLNNDGKDDFIIGAPRSNPGGLNDAGSAYVYSGATGGLLYQKDGVAAGDNFGWSVAGAEDVNGDGRPDFIIGAPFADPGGITLAGSVFVYSGLDGSLLVQIDGALSGEFGFSVAGAGDVNGNGKSDFIVGAPLTNLGVLREVGSVYVYSFSPTGVTREEFAGIPASFTLAQNFPNPFNASTQIIFDLPGAAIRPVRLEVFDILGRKIVTLIDQSFSGGRYHITWDGRDGQGKAVASGVYFYRLAAGEFRETRRMTLIK